MINSGHVYILTNTNKTVLYTGVTNDLVRRLLEHKGKQNKGFASKYKVDQLVFYESHTRIVDAISREKEIKRKSRRRKESLIKSMNPSWIDLSESLLEGL